ncbi:muscarinic acetylcholine receptor M1-like [Asterias rubens]|uniref:muscarinic acetylcholine receptor M1-like n=1 Tax=Asterias rubens TaxID=7604 RepID=UPI00145588C3|nr:muscarinic acetylcholine receptor M1-like [Asterias rubens]XP_033640446.1 muscarinic acetylcholine receptor M1-like [Asterias rubens]XP_033640451.1 muscarinic acetylcholine receptor M1-like [Asterias rubens]XP_033640460.1 muscarinic acetylcholine receptor M1-like [Asterias rubens]
MTAYDEIASWTTSATGGTVSSENFTAELTGNNTGADPRPPFGTHPLWAAILIIIVAGCLSVFTVSANLMVWISFFMDKQLQVINNYFLLSLAVADVILGAISIPLYTVYLLQGEWRLGPVVCDIWLSIDYAASNASVMNLCIICFDRYLSITRPLTYRANRTPRKVKFMISAAWGVSLVIWVPLIIGWQFFVGQRNIGEGYCAIQFLTDEIILNIITIVIAFYVPVSLMCVLYYRIWRETEKRARELGNLQAGGRDTNTSKHLLSSDEGNEHPEKSHRCAGLKARLLCCVISDIYDDELEESSDIASTMPATTTNSHHVPSGKSRSNHNHVHSASSKPSSPSLSPETRPKRAGRVTPESPVSDADKSFAASLYTILIKLPGENGVNPGSDQPKITLIEGEPINDTCAALLQDQDGTHLVTPHKQQHVCHRERAGSTTSIQSGKNKPLTISTISMVNKMAARAKTNVVKRKKSALIREKKAARTLCAILSVFIITWTPYSILVLATYGQNLEEQPVLQKMFDIAYWLCYLNSTANPICYALCNANFRRSFIRILHCQWKPKRPNAHRTVHQTNSSTRR